MDELQELIERLGTDDPPTDEELADAKAEAQEAINATVGEDVDTPDLEAGAAARAVYDKIGEEQEARAVKAQEDAEAAAKLREGITPAVQDDEEDEDEEGEELETVETTEADATSEPIAANIDFRALGRARSRVQANAEPPVRTTDVRVRSLGVAAGEPVGPDTTLDDVANIFSRHAASVKDRARPGGARGQTLVRLEFDYPDSRQLSGNQAVFNDRLIDSVLAPQALAAAGGICEPLPADFSHPLCSDRGRPIRDGLPRFGAERGGVRFSPAVSIGLLDDAITVWDIATDESPGEDTKACLVVDCEEEEEAKVDAIVACLQVGNFQARFNPEFWRNRLDLLMIQHDRTAEQTLYAAIDGASTNVTYGGAGTVQNVLGALDRAVAGLRSRHRYGGQIRTIAPDWLHQAIRSHLAFQKFGELAQLSVGDALVSQYFAVRNVSPIWSQDVAVFGAQGATALVDFPGTVDIQIFPEGAFFFMDGATLDLGTDITDSTLNATNDRQAFMETFEKAVFRGCEALRLRVNLDESCVCADVFEVTSP